MSFSGDNDGFRKDEKPFQEPSVNARFMSLNLRVSTCEGRLADHSFRMDEYDEELNELRMLVLELKKMDGDSSKGSPS